MVDGSIVKIQYPVTFENETPTAINKLVVMSKKQAPRSTVWINEEGLAKIRERMAKLEKPDHDNKRGKSCWTVEYLAQQAYVSQSTIKRLLNKKVPIDQTSAISILDKLGFVSSSFIDEHDQMLKTYNQNQPLSSEVDWQKVCLEMLQEQQEDQQIRRKATEMGFEVKVYVPLGLVERKQQQRRSGIINTEQIHQLDQEVITQIYKYQEFLDDIIGQQPTDQDQHIAIIGEPGAGKTTLLDRIATYIKDKNQDLFICISLANLQGRPLKTYILNEWLPQAIALSYPEFDPDSLEKTFQHRLNQGGVWLLLDGADEGKLSLAEIQTELSNFVKIRVVLTCRTNVWDIYVNNPLMGFKTYKTQDFKPEQIDEFIQKWFVQAKDEPKGKKLQEELKEPQRDRIRQLVANPLRLALLCQIFYKVKNPNLPETKAGLYEQFVRYFYEWKPAIVGIDWGTQPQLQDELHQGLGKLAIAGLDSNYRYRFPLSLITTEMDDRLFKLAWDLGWLTLVDREEKTDEAVYAFYHPTFQEYFAALAIDNWDFFLPDNHVDRPVPGKRYRIFESQWKEVILLWIGQPKVLLKQKQEFIQRLIDFNDSVEERYKFYAYFLAITAVFENQKTKLDFFINKLIDYAFIEFIVSTNIIFMNHNHPVSELAINVLKKIDREKSINAIVNFMNNCTHPERFNLAIKTLGEIGMGHKKVRVTLTKILTSNRGKDIKEKTTERLFELYSPHDELALIYVNCITENIDKNINFQAAITLLKIDPGNEKAIHTLVRLLEYEPSYKEDIQELFIEISHENSKNNNKLTEILLDKILNSRELMLNSLEIFRKISINNYEVIKILYQILESSHDELDKIEIGLVLLQITYENDQSIRTFTKIIEKSTNNELQEQVALRLQEIDINNEIIYRITNKKNHKDRKTDSRKNLYINKSFYDLIEIIENNFCKDIYTEKYEPFCLEICNELEKKFIADNLHEVNALVNTFFKITNTMVLWTIGGIFKKITISEQCYVVISAFKKLMYKNLKNKKIISREHLDLISREHLDFITRERDRLYFMICWHCAQHMSYPEFYQAWHESEKTIEQLETQYNDIGKLLKQLQPTDQVYPILINGKYSLENLTDESAIAQELCNQIHEAIFPDDDIPTVKNAPELKRLFPKFKRQLNILTLVFIIYNIEPYPELINVCRQLLGKFHIAFITDQQIEPDLRGFPIQSHLVNILQNWLTEISYKETL